MHHRKKQPPRTTTTRGDLPCPPCPSPMHPVLLLLLPRTTAPPPLLETVHRFTPPRSILLPQWWQRFFLLQPQQRMLLHRWLPVRLVLSQPTTTSNAPPTTTTARTTPSVDVIVRRDLWSIPFWAFGNNKHRPPCPYRIVVVATRTRTTFRLDTNHAGNPKQPPKRRPSCYSSRRPLLRRISTVVSTMPVRPIQSHHHPITTRRTATITRWKMIQNGEDYGRRIILSIITTRTMTTTIILIRIWTKTNCPLSWPMRNRIKRRVNERIVHGNQFNKRFDPVICCCNDGIQD